MSAASPRGGTTPHTPRGASGAGRVVLVTGGASGIGRAVAAGFAAAGDRVVIADRDAEAAAQAAKDLNAHAVTMDITDAGSVAAGVAHVAEAIGPVEVLVNNAGLVAGGGPLTSLPLEIFDTVVAVNLRGTFTVTQAVASQMVERAIKGRIVNISSIGARQPTPGLGHYEATKAAVDALTRTAALELAGHGIRVNGVAPGPVHTPMTAGLMENPEARAAWESRIPLAKIATTDDVVPLVLFLASDQAGHITGAIVQVDGGQLLT